MYNQQSLVRKLGNSPRYNAAEHILKMYNQGNPYLAIVNETLRDLNKMSIVMRDAFFSVRRRLDLISIILEDIIS